MSHPTPSLSVHPPTNTHTLLPPHDVGNLVSRSGLDLSQVSGFTVVAEKLNFFRYLSHFRCVSAHGPIMCFREWLLLLWGLTLSYSAAWCPNTASPPVRCSAQQRHITCCQLCAGQLHCNPAFFIIRLALKLMLLMMHTTPQVGPPWVLLCRAPHNNCEEAAARVMGLPVPSTHTRWITLWLAQPLCGRLCRYNARSTNTRAL
jgi:hypothetical protein